MTTTTRITITTATARRQSGHQPLAAPNGHAAVELAQLAAAEATNHPHQRLVEVLHQSRRQEEV